MKRITITATIDVNSPELWADLDNIEEFGWLISELKSDSKIFLASSGDFLGDLTNVYVTDVTDYEEMLF